MMLKKLKTVRNMSPVAKAALAYTFAGLATRGLSIITVPIFTRIMSTAEIGTVNVFNSWYAMLSAVSTLSLTSGGFMVGMKDYSDRRDQYTSSVLTITTLMAFIIAGVYFVAEDFWNRFFDLPTDLVVLMLIGLLVSPARDFWLSRQRYEVKYKGVVMVSLGTAVLGTVLSIIMLMAANKRGIPDVDRIRLYSNNLIVYGVALAFFVGIFIKGKTLFNKEFWAFSLKLSIPLIGNSVASQVLSVSDRTMINSLVGKSAVGIYSTLYNVSALSMIVWNAMNNSFVPYMFENMETKDGRHNIRKNVNYILLGYAVVALGMTLLAPEIVRILATEEYYEAIFLMPPIAAGIFLTSLGNLYSNILLYHKKTQYILIATIVAATLNVSLNALLIPIYGYQAAAYTTLTAYIVMAIIEALVANGVEKKLTGHREPLYNSKLLLLIAVAVVLCCLLINAIYGYAWIRWSMILIGLAIALINRKHMLKFVKEVMR